MDIVGFYLAIESDSLPPKPPRWIVAIHPRVTSDHFGEAQEFSDERDAREALAECEREGETGYIFALLGS